MDNPYFLKRRCEARGLLLTSSYSLGSHIEHYAESEAKSNRDISAYGKGSKMSVWT